MKWISLILMLLTMLQLEAHMLHQAAPIKQEWQEENLSPFDELMLSWNANRPEEGKFLFYISVKTDDWSPWLLYASWGSEGQSSFQSAEQKFSVKSYQDAVEVIDGKKATAFRIKVLTEGQAQLNYIHGLHVYTNSDKVTIQAADFSLLPSVDLKVHGISQMALQHPRNADLCSPTSTTAVTRYLSNDDTIDPRDFAKHVWDGGFDIFGNWVFAVGQASTHLGNKWDCWVERLRGFLDIHQHLMQGTPVVVSVRGPLPGSAKPYAKGHLLAVIGYDAVNQKVMCMDPAFPADLETHVSYNLSDFVQAWGRRGNIAYVFIKNKQL
jgi:hypothetical protein